jgi:endonuclease-3 related protein
VSRPSCSPDWDFATAYRRLYAAFGPQHWWPAETPFEVAVGAVLTQNTAWTNVERAIANLRGRELLAPAALAALDPAELAEPIRPAGYFNIKARRLQALCRFVLDELGGDITALAHWELAEARRALLTVNGVGEETADSILLYACGHAVFVVDAYTRRIFERLGLLAPGLAYREVQAAFQEALPTDMALYNEYHALIVALGKDYCRPRPACEACPLAFHNQ